MNSKSTSQHDPISKRFDLLHTQVRDALTEGASWVAQSAAESSSPDEIHALLTDAVAPAVALIDQFLRDLDPQPDQSE